MVNCSGNREILIKCIRLNFNFFCSFTIENSNQKGSWNNFNYVTVSNFFLLKLPSQLKQLPVLRDHPSIMLPPTEPKSPQRGIGRLHVKKGRKKNDEF